MGSFFNIVLELVFALVLLVNGRMQTLLDEAIASTDVLAPANRRIITGREIKYDKDWEDSVEIVVNTTVDFPDETFLKAHPNLLYNPELENYLMRRTLSNLWWDKTVVEFVKFAKFFYYSHYKYSFYGANCSTDLSELSVDEQLNKSLELQVAAELTLEKPRKIPWDEFLVQIADLSGMIQEYKDTLKKNNKILRDSGGVCEFRQHHLVCIKGKCQCPQLSNKIVVGDAGGGCFVGIGQPCNITKVYYPIDPYLRPLPETAEEIVEELRCVPKARCWKPQRNSIMGYCKCRTDMVTNGLKCEPKAETPLFYGWMTGEPKRAW